MGNILEDIFFLDLLEVQHSAFAVNMALWVNISSNSFCVLQNPDSVVVKQIFRVRTADGVFADTFPLSEIVK